MAMVVDQLRKAIECFLSDADSQERGEICHLLTTYADMLNKEEANCERSREAENMKQRSGELMRDGNMDAAIKLYNKAWEKERARKW